MLLPHSNVQSKIKSYLLSPGRRNDIKSHGAFIYGSEQPDKSDIAFDTYNTCGQVEASEDAAYSSKGFPIFDRLTAFAGSTTLFLLVMAILVGWIIAGIILKGPTDWQVAMNDGSSIQVYITNTLLIHQQFLNYEHSLGLLANMRSRSLSIGQMLKALEQRRALEPSFPSSESTKPDQDLPSESNYYRFCNKILASIGSPFFIIIYWSGIFVWLGFGPSLQWSNFWQLVINTATAVELTFTTVFLQHIRRRQMEYNDEYMKVIISADERILEKLGLLSGTLPSHVAVVIPKPPMNKAERFVDYYAAVLGGVPGMTAFVVVTTLWLAVGKLMNWSSNWWLIIGTYTGLISFIDEFVLRNIQIRDNDYICAQFEEIDDVDNGNLRTLQVSPPQPPTERRPSLFHRIIEVFIFTFSRWEAVIASFFATVAMLAVATGMMWNETGQLICNTPTMIIEGFLMVILIHGQRRYYNMRQGLLSRALLKRQILLNRLESVRPVFEENNKGVAIQDSVSV